MAENQDYLMESPDENLRLERKTRDESVREQALWCGIKPGMSVLDAGCGPGKTTALLHQIIQPGGRILGVDYAEKRITYAKEKYGNDPGIDFRLHDLRDPLDCAEVFDLIWVRFVLEYNRAEGPEIVRYLTNTLKPGGTICLIDLDYNCLTHYKLPDNMEAVFLKIAAALERNFNFDPFIGRKLYSYLYDLDYDQIEVELKAHHLFYGNIGENDLFNWQKKIEMASTKGRDLINEYPGGSERFTKDFKSFFSDPRRFTYTPLIMCKGTKPV